VERPILRGNRNRPFKRPEIKRLERLPLGIALISTVGLRHQDCRCRSVAIKDPRNCPDQYGGIATGGSSSWCCR
jgi:hypothetical protein